MSDGSRVVDDGLRIRALEALGPLGDELAREALTAGSVSVERDVLAWEGSHGTVRAHRVTVTVETELHRRVTASYAAVDGLNAAVSAAVSERPAEALADLVVAAGMPPSRGGGGPYREPRGS